MKKIHTDNEIKLQNEIDALKKEKMELIEDKMYNDQILKKEKEKAIAEMMKAIDEKDIMKQVLAESA